MTNLLLFLVIFSASLSGGDDFDFYDFDFYDFYSNFAHNLNSQLWMETRGYCDKKTKLQTKLN